jgi:hypothetical protein
MQFQCARCRNILTKNLTPKPKQLGFCLSDGQALLEQGFASNEFNWHADLWVINQHDNIGMDVTEDASRTNGCCNLDGCDGLNLRCRQCRNYVATAKLDC